jgi:mannose/fructose/N-acetylgalactosamine-specific phosphotransferase system component IIB
VPLLLARIDDRLIHGQVAHGWARPLGATLIAIVSDDLRARPQDADLYLLAVPDGASGCVVSVAEALEPAFRARVLAERTVLLFPGTTEPVRLAEGGFPLGTLNLGGLHFAPEKREFLPFVYLDDADVQRLRRLRELGVRLEAQDLPGNPAHPLEAILNAESS